MGSTAWQRLAWGPGGRRSNQEGERGSLPAHLLCFHATLATGLHYFSGKQPREVITAVLGKSKGRNKLNLGWKKEKYRMTCLLIPLSFFSPWLHPEIFPLEEACILPPIFSIKWLFIFVQDENLTKDNPSISQR